MVFLGRVRNGPAFFYYLGNINEGRKGLSLRLPLIDTGKSLGMGTVWGRPLKYWFPPTEKTLMIPNGRPVTPI